MSNALLLDIPFSNREVTVVQEYNVRVRGDKCTIWVAPGYYDDSRDHCPSFREMASSVKIAGPIDTALGLEIFRALTRIFSQCGFRVSELMTADD